MGTASVAAPVPAGGGWAAGALTRIGIALDRAALAGMRLAFSEALHPSDGTPDRLAASARPYLDPLVQREPRRFFAFLDDDGGGTPSVRTLEERTVPGGAVAVREMDTEYVPWHASPSWPACAENARLPFEHWTHRPGPARAVVVALHGFTMGRPWIDGHVLMAAQWFAIGFDVVLPVLPFHGARAPRWARYSGEAFGSWDVARLNEAVRQAVHDVDLLRRWALDAGARAVGVVGLSLGGYLTALLAGLRADLAFAIPLAPPVSLAWLPQHLFGCGWRRTRRPPIPPEVLAATYRLHSPLTFPLAIPRERAVVVGGLGDRVVPPEQIVALWRHWGEPAIHWFNGGHTTPFGRTQIMTRIEAHLRPLV